MAGQNQSDRYETRFVEGQEPGMAGSKRDCRTGHLQIVIRRQWQFTNQTLRRKRSRSQEAGRGGEGREDEPSHEEGTER